MLSLQFLALEALGESADPDVPQVENVMFDVNQELKKINDELAGLYVIYKKLKKITPLQEPDLVEYTFYTDLISSALFDSFVYRKLTTHVHVAWKEYFHGMYELCVMPKIEDKICWQIMVNSSLQNFEILPVPVEMPPEDDTFFRLILYIRDLFDHLKGLHENLVIKEYPQKLREKLEDEHRTRCEIMDICKKIKELETLQKRYVKMLTLAKSA
jgi:hypothetical protein